MGYLHAVFLRLSFKRCFLFHEFLLTEGAQKNLQNQILGQGSSMRALRLKCAASGTVHETVVNVLRSSSIFQR